jgi:hypothetical protein
MPVLDHLQSAVGPEIITDDVMSGSSSAQAIVNQRQHWNICEFVGVRGLQARHPSDG